MSKELFSVIKNNDIEIVKLLIENGADVNAKNEDGETALHLANRKGYLDIVKYLIAKGAKE